jgi:DnaJ family protein C protein 7
MKMLGQNGLVNPKTKRYSREVPPAAHLQFTSFNSKNPPSSAQSPSSSPIPQGHSAGDVNEQGNVAFKAKQYTEAIQLYTKAIGMIQKTQHTSPSLLIDISFQISTQ